MTTTFMAVEQIVSMTRDNNAAGARAFQLWDQGTKDSQTGEYLDPIACAQLAKQQLYDESHKNE